MLILLFVLAGYSQMQIVCKIKKKKNNKKKHW